MRVLDRYVARELLGPFLFGFGLFSMALVCGDALFKLTLYLAQGAPPLLVLKLFGLKLVTQTVFTLPMAMLLSVLLAFGRLSGDSELVSTQASGIPFSRLAVAPACFGLVVSLCHLVLLEYAIPPASKASRQTERVIQTLIAKEMAAAAIGNQAIVAQQYDGETLRSVMAAQRVDPLTGHFHKVALLEYHEGKLRTILQAQEAEWAQGSDWRFRNVEIVTLGLAGGRQAWVRDVESLVVRAFHKTPRQIESEQRKPYELSYPELRWLIASLKSQGAPKGTTRRLEVGLHNKLSTPFASLVFAVLAAPLGLRRHRSGPGIGLGISILVMFGYYFLWHGMTIMGEHGQVPPWAAAWAANIGCTLAGIVMIRRASR